ncbi:hypothetical protein CHU32_11415 [Superficieibacter electus]|uniref:Uncharacterized protein n=1 Tax=Superficieibacter electus TaxID=2022662 RepID=A0A2P5GQ72_9ENTR|nr:hypothetical protein [Superficieibacter electus]POP45560.1 hypothetical protein CHU33_08485 [Superficieibacter electus]POP48721.1 hypothetical protein CHU32_11415 [Superficieibacter electus]
MNISPEMATPVEKNVKMVSVALSVSIASLVLFALMVLFAVFADGSDEWIPVLDLAIMAVWCIIFLLMSISLPMSIAGMIASTRRLKALLAFFISGITLTLLVGSIFLAESM